MIIFLVFADTRTFLLAGVAEEPHGVDDRFHGHLCVPPAEVDGQHRSVIFMLFEFEMQLTFWLQR